MRSVKCLWISVLVCCAAIGCNSNSRFGVLAGRVQTAPDVIATVTDLHAAWARVNVKFDNKDVDVKPYLDAGVNLVLTVSNRNPDNIVDENGNIVGQNELDEHPKAGFHFADEDRFDTDIANTLGPLLYSLDAGRKLWIQCGNEVIPGGAYWAGTIDQYLDQLRALAEEVRSLDERIGVVLTSFASATLDRVLENDPLAMSFVTDLLTRGAPYYDAVDLHFYGCVEQIPDKIHWVKDNMPASKQWISTENGGPDSRCPTTPIQWTPKTAWIFERVQAQQVPARLTECADGGGSICLWFSLYDLVREESVFSHLGLLDPRVMPPLQKPAYSAFKSFAATHQ